MFNIPKGLLAAGLVAASGVAFTFTSPAAAVGFCARGFYACNINADGSLDRNHPGCCLDATAIGFARACGPGFYSCRFNDGGSRDPAHPGCCLNVPGFPHVR